MSRFFCRSAASAMAVISLLSVGTAQTSLAQKNSEAEKLLTDSNAFAGQLDPGRRASYLVSLTRAAADIPHEQTREWCLDQYRLAPQIDDIDWNIIYVQKNAVSQLSRVDARKAMELLATLKQPQYPSGTPPESLAADAAVPTFINYWRSERDKLSALAEIERLAKFIPDKNDGQYPFKAMASIVEELSRRETPDATESTTRIVGDALQYYLAGRASRKKDPNKGFGTANREFFKLMQAAQANVVRAVYGHALHEFVDGLLEDASQATPNQQIMAYTASGSFRLGSEAEELLLRALDLVTALDSDWAAKLQSDNPDIFQHVGARIENVERGVIEGMATPDQVAKLRQQMEEHAAIAKIEFMKQVNPWGAVDIAKKLTTPSKRFTGYSLILSSMAELDPSQAARLYSQQLSEMKEIENSDAKLSVTLQLAKAAFFVGDSKAFSEYALKTLDYGAKLSEKASTKDVEDRPGYRELADLVEFSSQHGQSWIEDSVREMPDPALKAYLLVAAARGVIKKKIQLSPAERSLKVQNNPAPRSPRIQSRTSPLH